MICSYLLNKYSGCLPITRHKQILTLILTALVVLSLFYLPFSLNFVRAETDPAWSTLSSMPTPRAGFGLAVVNGKIYAIGGINSDNVPLRTVEEYNPVTDTWTTRLSMPTARSGFAVAVYNHKIYVIGGTVGDGYVGNNEVYDPVTNTWTTKASMPTPRADLCASTIDGKIYLIGGKKYSSSAPFYIETDTNECYDPVSDIWETKTPIPTAVQGYGCVVVDKKIFVIGGSREPTSPGTSITVNNNQVYDSITDKWSTAASLPTATSYGAAAATQGYLAPQGIYYVGGFTGGVFTGQVKILTLSNNSWSIAESMPTPRGYLGLVAVNDMLYAIGGFDGTDYLSVNERYKPVGYGTVPPKISVLSPENKTYTVTTLDFTINRDVQWIGYSLDGKQNVTVTSGLQLSGLTHGPHHITVYANDTSGNMAVSETVHFSVDLIGPEIMILSPKNQSYDTTDMQLTFTINEPVTYLAYILDDQEIVPIVGNVTLVALSNGAHRLTIYAIDELGNTSNETIYFLIATFPILAVIAAVVIIIIMVAIGYILFKRRY
ncbi:MAG: kelch repeat-containing protein [Candidatus Bathyarchaeota archaeon]|jgi:N-acetylneuraminic acid mutarotase|nr:kelch repeat-containing protein [Candidatus Bathyarchaeota archaeon]MDD4325559.1 kelch repeat-containing protein [Candidatus Bathyarchaeota archaeon]